MSCTTDNKFTVSKGMDNEFIITIKQNGTTLPMTIEPTDTFEVRLIKLENSTLVSTLTSTASAEGLVEVYDAANGKIKINMYQSLVDTLEIERGDKADKYYTRATYRISIHADTTNNGKFTAVINEVFVR